MSAELGIAFVGCAHLHLPPRRGLCGTSVRIADEALRVAKAHVGAEPKFVGL